MLYQLINWLPFLSILTMNTMTLSPEQDQKDDAEDTAAKKYSGLLIRGRKPTDLHSRVKRPHGSFTETHPHRLEDTDNQEYEDDSWCQLIDTIESRDGAADDDRGAAMMEILREKIANVLHTLTYREREIVKLRYGLGEGYEYTLEECGRIFKLSGERVRQIEAKAIRKMQHPIRASQLEGFVQGVPFKN